jgi:hypothetical protein
MRIKVSIENSREYRHINIQSVEYREKTCKDPFPVIYFKCHSKYEHIFRNETVIFHDKNNKEMFRSKDVRLSYRYYESDTREKKVKLQVQNIEFEDLGRLSAEYLMKVLKRSCNAKVIPMYKPPQKERITYQKGVGRYMDVVFAQKGQCEYYKDYKWTSRIYMLLYTQVIHPITIIYEIISRAPT